MMEDLEQLERDFDDTKELKVWFTSGLARTYDADSYSVDSLMLNLFMREGERKVLVRMIPYMMIREIEVKDKKIKGLLKAKG
jgi:hypothetical protein